MKRLIGLGVGAVLGGLIGYYHVLCPGSQCAVTGSWYGGAVIGGLLGLWLGGGCPMCSSSKCETKPPDPSSDTPASPQA